MSWSRSAKYTAPQKISYTPEFATIEARAADGSGRVATAIIRIDGTPEPLVTTTPRVVLGPGEKLTFGVVGNVPVSWRIVRGGPDDGRFGVVLDELSTYKAPSVVKSRSREVALLATLFSPIFAQARYSF